MQQHLRLFRNDPERFAANLLQFTNPERFRERLIDVLTGARLHVRIDNTRANRPTLNVLQPVLSPTSMTGGPNTIINIAFWVARQGIEVRLVTTRNDDALDSQWFWRHLAAVTGASEPPSTLSLASASNPTTPLPIGPRDMFLATHWTTAQQVKDVVPIMEVKRFFYLIQDFEPGFYAWSSNYALALETYGLDHIGLFNERLLLDYLVMQQAGLYAEPSFAAKALVFEPAIDRKLFHPPAAPRVGGKSNRRLLFYTRPTNHRNMLGMGLNALRAAVKDPVFKQADWDFLAIGSRGSMPDLPLGEGKTLRVAPWQDFAEYAAQLSASDILLCPMLSPHTSYPVLEMAACGGMTVTNCFGTKTAAKLESISANIIATAPTTEDICRGLIVAAARVNRGVDIYAPLNLPASWRESLSGTATEMSRMFRAITGAT